MRKIVEFFVGARRGGSAKHTFEVIVGTGRVGRGLGKGGGGGGGLVGAGNIVVPCGGHNASEMGNCFIVSAIYCILRGLA